jgi:uncharacterized protein YdhG (YjbR/CyaY superfamily)
MKVAAKDANAYVAAAPPERRADLDRLRALVKKSVPSAKEDIQWGMIAFTVAGRTFAALASQKRYISLYLMDLYAQPGLREKHQAALAKLDMGKSCINFATADELPLPTIAAILAAAPNVSAPPPKKKAASKTTTVKIAPATKVSKSSAKRATTKRTST